MTDTTDHLTRTYRDARGIIWATTDTDTWTGYSRNGVIYVGPWPGDLIAHPWEKVPDSYGIPE